MPNPTGRYLSAAEAAERLQVSRATLYSYVSRGLLRSLPDPEGGRARRYETREVARLLAKGRRGGPSGRTAGVLDFGEPVLDSHLSLIDGRGLYYRGRSATELARTATLEQVARWLWLETPPGAPEGGPDDPFAGAPLPDAPPESALKAPRPDEALAAALPYGARRDAASWDLRPAATARTGARILRYLARTAALWAPPQGAPADRPAVLQGGSGSSSSGGPGRNDRRAGKTAITLQRAWLPERPEAATDLDAALVLSADHGLNVSSFVARCVASAKSTPWAAVQAGLAALGGARHGGHTFRVTALLDEIGPPGRTRGVLAERLRRGEGVPGFGHPLYPEGDPRALELLARAAKLAPEQEWARIETLVESTWSLLGERPTIAVGLVALSRALALPHATPIALFALGRCTGWLAHVLEEQSADRLIRPRARYIGPMPPAEE